MKIAKTIDSARKAIKQARRVGGKIGFVPTMGALHIGHISLIKAAVKKCDFVVVSIFVNPTQFGPGEDYKKYPRMPQADFEICRKEAVDLVFAPSPEQMYPVGSFTSVDVEKLTEPLCGRFRPGHFRGVTTVCAKLFNIIQPDIAFFGQKDAQQAAVIKQMTADLNMPLEIAICPLVRAPDGLAVSSRNKYLLAGQRKRAAYIYKALQRGRELIEKGEKNSPAVIKDVRSILNNAGLTVQYAEVVDVRTLQKINRIKTKVMLAVAVEIGRTRLIDNIVVDTGR